MALALATYAIVAGFTLPWYALWSIPVAAMSLRRPIAVVAAWHGAILLAAYQAGTASAAGRISGGLLTMFLPLATVAILLVLVLDRPAGTRLGLRRVDVDAASGELGAELVQRGERRVGCGAGRWPRPRGRAPRRRRASTPWLAKRPGCAPTAPQGRVHAAWVCGRACR